MDAGHGGGNGGTGHTGRRRNGTAGRGYAAADVRMRGCAGVHGMPLGVAVTEGLRADCNKACLPVDGLEPFQSETPCIPNHTACRFAEKTRCFHSVLAGMCCHRAFRLFQRPHAPDSGTLAASRRRRRAVSAKPVSPAAGPVSPGAEPYHGMPVTESLPGRTAGREGAASAQHWRSLATRYVRRSAPFLAAVSVRCAALWITVPIDGTIGVMEYEVCTP